MDFTGLHRLTYQKQNNHTQTIKWANFRKLIYTLVCHKVCLIGHKTPILKCSTTSLYSTIAPPLRSTRLSQTQMDWHIRNVQIIENTDANRLCLLQRVNSFRRKLNISGSTKKKMKKLAKNMKHNSIEFSGRYIIVIQIFISQISFSRTIQCGLSYQWTVQWQFIWKYHFEFRLKSENDRIWMKFFLFSNWHSALQILSGFGWILSSIKKRKFHFLLIDMRFEYKQYPQEEATLHCQRTMY